MRVFFNSHPARGAFAAAAFSLLAGIALAATAPAPARAAGPDMRTACKYSASPQGYGESIRYNNCMRQLECQEMANKEGHVLYTKGCFGVAPDAPVPGARH